MLIYIGIAVIIAAISLFARHQLLDQPELDVCPYGSEGCRGYRHADPCERCHYDSFV